MILKQFFWQAAGDLLLLQIGGIVCPEGQLETALILSYSTRWSLRNIKQFSSPLLLESFFFFCISILHRSIPQNCRDVWKYHIDIAHLADLSSQACALRSHLLF